MSKLSDGVNSSEYHIVRDFLYLLRDFGIKSVENLACHICVANGDILYVVTKEVTPTSVPILYNYKVNDHVK